MTTVEIYTKDYCPYCKRAKELLTKKKVAFTEYDVTYDQEKFEEMVERSFGRRTVPQIFINDTHIGGCDDMHELDDKGKLDSLLS